MCDAKLLIIVLALAFGCAAPDAAPGDGDKAIEEEGDDRESDFDGDVETFWVDADAPPSNEPELAPDDPENSLTALYFETEEGGEIVFFDGDPSTRVLAWLESP